MLVDRPESGAAFITSSTLRCIAGRGIVEIGASTNGDSRSAAVDFTLTSRALGARAQNEGEQLLPSVVMAVSVSDDEVRSMRCKFATKAPLF